MVVHDLYGMRGKQVIYNYNKNNLEMDFMFMVFPKLKIKEGQKPS